MRIHVDGATLRTADSYYNGDIIVDNTTDDAHDASYYVDATMNGGLWLVNESGYPQWQSYARNQTTVYNEHFIEFNASWTDEALYGFIFSINQTGNWENSSLNSFSGTYNVSENTTQITAAGGTNVSWRIWARDISGNWNATPIDSFIVQPKSVAIDLSPALQDKISWNITSLPAVNISALENNGAGTTEYWVNVTCAGTLVDVYMKATGNLVNGSNFIAIPNETFSYSTTDNTVPGTPTSITTSYSDNQIGDGLNNGDFSWIKFFLSVPGNQAPGSYKNNVTFTAVEYGDAP
ncbi:MAG: hypothetical protein R6U97_09755 [Desulfosalsimonas sp.]